MSELHSVLYCFWKVIYLNNFRHVVADDLGQCKFCKFPVNYSYIKRMLVAPDIERTCPMCNVDITLEDVEYLGEKGVPGLKKVFVKEEEKKK